MHDTIMPPKGRLRLVIRNRITGAIVKEWYHDNTFTYLGTGILAQALAGNNTFRITHCYGEHADAGTSGYIEGTTNGLTVARTDTVATLRTAPRSTTDAEAPILFPVFSTSGVVYSGNVVTFAATFDNDNIDGRIIVGAGLVCVINGVEYLVAHSYFPATIKQANHELIAYWSLTFN